MNINSYIDHTLLSSTATESDIIKHCNQAKKHKFYSVCINSCYVPLANQLLKDTDVKICAVVGFPFGANSTRAKVFESKQAIDDGAHEIDMVINLGFFKSKNYVEVFKDIKDVKSAIGKIPLKVILEISELSKNGIVKASEICTDANVDFIKTSTGFTKSGATLTAVKIIKKTVKNKCKIKASGGISDYETAKKYIEVGADRIGTSKGVVISENEYSNMEH
ncbi:deoxyribose-phosphate aldolase [Psychroserpens sp. Hel_I_66]|uniref:deoxyribose-phosphate aldolase n=1 Tax=Psychroserpens sp. Hel_I_66 TaxID=1250004 RepID=UPI00064628CD|nr:deoxyribose-phosphate aldolase [Psychroserpens sp. Hel_I_66]